MSEQPRYRHFTLHLEEDEENPAIAAIEARNWTWVSEAEADLYQQDWASFDPISTLDKLIIAKYGKPIVRPITQWDLDQFLDSPGPLTEEEIRECNAVIAVRIGDSATAKYPVHISEMEPGSAN